MADAVTVASPLADAGVIGAQAVPVVPLLAVAAVELLPELDDALIPVDPDPLELEATVLPVEAVLPALPEPAMLERPLLAPCGAAVEPLPVEPTLAIGAEQAVTASRHIAPWSTRTMAASIRSGTMRRSRA